MTTTPEPSWYDVLDVPPDAPTGEVDRAWRAAIADLTPADRRFRLYNQAAEVLLDPQRRAAYDAELAAAAPDEDEPVEGEPATASEAAPGPRPRVETLPTTPVVIEDRDRRPLPRVPGWLVVGLAILTAVSVGVMAYLWTQPSEGAVAAATGSARTAAERAAVPVLSYDYHSLDQDQDSAHRYLTSGYRSEYDKLFDGVLRPNAKSTETVVDTQVIASAVVRGGEDRADILLFLNQPTTNKTHDKPEVYKNQATFRMERVGDQWLVDCIITDLTGKC